MKKYYVEPTDGCELIKKYYHPVEKFKTLEKRKKYFGTLTAKQSQKIYYD